MKLRTQFSLFAAALAALAVALSGGAVYLLEQQRTARELDSDRLALAQEFAGMCAEAVVTEDEVAVVHVAAAFRKIHPDLLYAVLERGSRRIPPGTVGQPGALEKTAGVIWRGRTLAQVRLGFSPEAAAARLSETRRSFARRLGWAVGAALVLAVGAALLITRRVTRPLQALADGARAIAGGRLDHRVVVTGHGELALLETEFNQMAEGLAKVDELKRDFLAAVTHDLKSPLSGVEGFAALIQDDLGEGRLDRDQAMKWLHIIRGNIARLRRSVDNILDMARIEAGALEIQREPFDAGLVVAEALETFQPLARERGVALSFESDGDRTAIRGDADKVHRIAANLIANALKFTPEGGHVVVRAGAGVASPATAGLDPAGRILGVVVEVSDTGSGIPAESLPRIFDRFHQVPAAFPLPSGERGGVRDGAGLGRGVLRTPTSGTLDVGRGVLRTPTPGTLDVGRGVGLGLAIVKAFTEAHGGRVTVESELGKGSRFRVWFPAP